MTAFFKLDAKRFSVLLFLCCSWSIIAAHNVAQADSGSSQAVMALIVPPQGVAGITAQQQPDPATPSQPYYNHDSSVQFTRQVGENTCQVWVTF